MRVILRRALYWTFLVRGSSGWPTAATRTRSSSRSWANEQGQNLNATVTLQPIQDGTIRVVLSKAYADADPVFPIPGWSKV